METPCVHPYKLSLFLNIIQTNPEARIYIWKINTCSKFFVYVTCCKLNKFDIKFFLAFPVD